jgi:uncharacterized protein YbaA (DUF1428 family)
MGRYVDLYLLTVPRKNLAAYRKLAKRWGAIMADAGVLAYREFVASGAKPMKGMEGMKGVDTLLKPKKGEVVIFSVVEFKSKAHHDATNERGWKDPRMQELMEMKPIFDMKSMRIGEFETLVEQDAG